MQPRGLCDSVSGLQSAVGDGRPFAGRLPSLNLLVSQESTSNNTTGPLSFLAASLDPMLAFSPYGTGNHISHTCSSLLVILLRPLMAIRQGKLPFGTLGASPHDHLGAVGQPARQQGGGCLLASNLATATTRCSCSSRKLRNNLCNDSLGRWGLAVKVQAEQPFRFIRRGLRWRRRILRASTPRSCVKSVGTDRGYRSDNVP